MSAKNLNLFLPVYVTRKNAGGETGTYSMSLWMTLVAMLLVWLNIVVWGVIGLVYSVLVWL